MFLGVTIDKKLKFDTVLTKLVKKFSKSIGILYKLHLIVPKNILTNIYNSIVYPYLNYCNIMWGYSYHINLQHVPNAEENNKKFK